MALGQHVRDLLRRAMADLAASKELADAVDNAGNATSNITSGPNGTLLGTNANQKFGRWGVTPVVQPNSTGNLIGSNGNGATNANAVNQNANGNMGNTFYSLNDLVRNFKLSGDLAP